MRHSHKNNFLNLVQESKKSLPAAIAKLIERSFNKYKNLGLNPVESGVRRKNGQSLISAFLMRPLSKLYAGK